MGVTDDKYSVGNVLSCMTKWTFKEKKLPLQLKTPDLMQKGEK
jgi:hypothetical protein